MVRRSSLIIGVGLALLWAIGLGLDRHASLLWFNAVAAIIAFSIGGLIQDEHDPANGVGLAILGLGLAALWIVGIASRQPTWAVWAQFPFAVACLAVAVMAASGRQIEVRSRSRRRIQHA